MSVAWLENYPNLREDLSHHGLYRVGYTCATNNPYKIKRVAVQIKFCN